MIESIPTRGIPATTTTTAMTDTKTISPATNALSSKPKIEVTVAPRVL